jgi:hypothetical protein
MFASLDHVHRIRNPHKTKTVVRNGMELKPGKTIKVPGHVSQGDIDWMLRHGVVEDPDAERKASLREEMAEEVARLESESEDTIASELDLNPSPKAAPTATPKAASPRAGSGTGRSSSAKTSALGGKTK